MRCIRVGEGEGLAKLSVGEADDPGPPGPGEVRVRVRACSLNFHDYAVCSGKMETAPGRIPLADGAGEVEAVGEGVRDFSVGDRVVSVFYPDWPDGAPVRAGFGSTPGDGVDGFAQEVAVRPAQAFTRAPEGWSHEEAACIPTAGVTAWRALVVEGGLAPGQTVLTMGTGGVSIWAVQLALAGGARVLGTSSSDEKREALEKMGVAMTANYRTDEAWGRTLAEASGGADIVVEVGGPGTLDQAIEAVALGGRIVMIGVLTGRSGEVGTAALMHKQARLQGVTVGSRAMQRDLVAACEVSGLRPVIDRRFDLADLADAFAHEEAGRHVGKIVVTC